jgi:hypothetical protein
MSSAMVNVPFKSPTAQPLNTALMREHYRLTTLEDVLPKLANARIFSKLDIREAYWHVKLSENSSRLQLTKFRLVIALSLFVGLTTPGDDNVIGDGKRTIQITNCFGQFSLKYFARYLQIILNDEKKEIGLKEITFHGHKITSDGVKVDDKKVNAIRKMPTPTDVADVYWSKRSSPYNMDSASFSICAQFLSDCRSAREANSTGFPSCSKTAPTKVIVQNDHKPLAAIQSKPLSRAPKRLQDIMMKLFRYDIEFRFVKGVNLIVADALSRAFVCMVVLYNYFAAICILVKAFESIQHGQCFFLYLRPVSFGLS